MPEYLAPGVYVEETGQQPRPIVGVSTAIAAFLGETKKGPAAPRIITGMADYERIYGAKAAARGFLKAALQSFFDNGGAQAWIARVKGKDGAPVAADYLGAPTMRVQGRRKAGTGLAGLSEIDEIGLVAAPGAPADVDVQRALVTHCEDLRNRIAILDGPQGAPDLGALDPRAADPAFNSSFAAYYMPWIAVGAADGGTVSIPPSGAVCGIIARVDAQRGVWKAPANEVVTGALGLDMRIDDGAQDLLNPRGVNGIRAVAGRGIRLWGARTLSDDAEWHYVPVRRLAIYLEQSIQRGLQWAVFEPNDAPLWTRMRQAAEDFLYRTWRDGALTGVKPEEAFFVHVGTETMTQVDIDNGRLIMEIGFAPLRSAEFVILRLMFGMQALAA